MKTGPLIILSGPSASGKSTLVQRLIDERVYPLRVSVSATTRLPRLGEMDGVHYHFWTPQRFEEGIRAGEFLEWAQVFGKDYYGTLRREVDDYTPHGIGVILVIDVQGAAQVGSQRPDAVSVFVRTSSMQEYEKRLRGRGTEDEAAIQRRLETAQRELERIGDYRYVIVNDDLAAAVAQFRGVLAPYFS
jgi:guanylate kinase